MHKNVLAAIKNQEYPSLGIEVAKTTDRKELLHTLLTEADYSKLQSNIYNLNGIVSKRNITTQNRSGDHEITQDIILSLFDELGLTLLQRGRIQQAMQDNSRRPNYDIAKRQYRIVVARGTREEQQIALLNLGEICRKQKEYNEAMAYYQQALVLGKNEYSEKAEMAILLTYSEHGGHFNEIKKIYDSIDTTMLDHHFFMGIARYNEGKNKKNSSASKMASVEYEEFCLAELEKCCSKLPNTGILSEKKNELTELINSCHRNRLGNIFSGLGLKHNPTDYYALSTYKDLGGLLKAIK